MFGTNGRGRGYRGRGYITRFYKMYKTSSFNYKHAKTWCFQRCGPDVRSAEGVRDLANVGNIPRFWNLIGEVGSVFLVSGSHVTCVPGGHCVWKCCGDANVTRCCPLSHVTSVMDAEWF